MWGQSGATWLGSLKLRLRRVGPIERHTTPCCAAFLGGLSNLRVAFSFGAMRSELASPVRACCRILGYSRLWGPVLDTIIAGRLRGVRAAK
jgi:hypothetical protein